MTHRDRVEGWKVIASALGQSVRTVQRWRANGLPVYRNPHTGHVWAYLGELLRWRDTAGECSDRSPPDGDAV